MFPSTIFLVYLMSLKNNRFAINNQLYCSESTMCVILAATIAEISGIDKIAGIQSSSIILGAIICALVPIISNSFQTYNCLRLKIRHSYYSSR